MSSISPLRVALVLVVFLGVVLVLGPRPRIDTTLYPVDLPVAPDSLRYAVALEEDAFDDLVPGADRLVVLRDPVDPRPTDHSLVYLHGFTASRQETFPLTRNLSDSLGANIFYARLRGHGRSPEALADVTMNDWINDGAEAMAIGSRIGEKVILIGTSTGGTLATWLASRPEYAERIAALILISPNYGPADPMAEKLLWPWGGLLLRMSEGDEICWEPANELQARYWTECYPSRAVLPMMALVQAARRVDRESISVPTLVLYSEADDVVDTERIKAFFESLGSPQKRIVAVPPRENESNHVLAGDIVSPSGTPVVLGEIMKFLGEVLPAQAAPQSTSGQG